MQLILPTATHKQRRALFHAPKCRLAVRCFIRTRVAFLRHRCTTRLQKKTRTQQTTAVRNAIFYLRNKFFREAFYIRREPRSERTFLSTVVGTLTNLRQAVGVFNSLSDKSSDSLTRAPSKQHYTNLNPRRMSRDTRVIFQPFSTSVSSRHDLSA